MNVRFGVELPATPSAWVQASLQVNGITMQF